MLTNVIKNGALLFVIGIAVAITAPYVISAISAIAPSLITAAVTTHATGSAAAALWTGTIFGLFGAFHAALGPVWDKLFGKMETAESVKAESTGKDVHIHNIQIAADVDVARAANFAHKIEQQRLQIGERVKQ